MLFGQGFLHFFFFFISSQRTFPDWNFSASHHYWRRISPCWEECVNHDHSLQMAANSWTTCMSSRATVHEIHWWSKSTWHMVSANNASQYCTHCKQFNQSLQWPPYNDCCEAFFTVSSPLLHFPPYIMLVGGDRGLQSLVGMPAGIHALWKIKDGCHGRHKVSVTNPYTYSTTTNSTFHTICLVLL